ncbi:hypothetical protein Ari01nite_69690 [Paractinoplanes rishiriensis]|uniref:Uncharacterized protein n=1 Tax=Paractinoplanes rishiriensis TaxID=1050105 RepID=A0A919MY66_9ACTN|nr:hypothetical protein Ari01nite_69690 [Actinoplanes rishiriensis]
MPDRVARASSSLLCQAYLGLVCVVAIVFVAMWFEGWPTAGSWPLLGFVVCGYLSSSLTHALAASQFSSGRVRAWLLGVVGQALLFTASSVGLSFAGRYSAMLGLLMVAMIVSAIWTILMLFHTEVRRFFFSGSLQ